MSRDHDDAHADGHFFEDPLLTTFELKQRGWTASMIQKLLPEHDDSRENRWNRKYGRVKLYRESRVQDAETTGAYAELLEKAIEASERAEKARQTRTRNRERKLRNFIEDFQPVLVPLTPQEQEKLSSSLARRFKQLWERHEAVLTAHLGGIQTLGKTTRKERKKLQAALQEKYLEALQKAYPELEFAESAED
ncbi:hypothetical protein [Deinococcus roseus]|uniref:Uncharacterized protein n=1 Tax=Deinococcus roseus TaxID=392414 RepID=A0ABQ2CVL7_9DEIO|nr:hypothetical protein [Deinococcus roseus]GGJ25307.1 hypothetical protein GCM10008938_09170 [Deinococcus roseus]